MRVRNSRLALIAIAALGASAPRTQRADADDPAKPSGSVRRCAVTGRIVDGWEDGVPGAKVAWSGDAPAGDRSTGAAVRTDDTGRFRLELDGPAGDEVRGTIHATRGDDGAAIAPIVVGAGDQVKDDETLELRSARPLYVDVRREGKPVLGAAVWLWCWAGNVYRGAPAFVGTATTDSIGRAEFGALPHAYIELFVRAPDGSVGERTRQVVPGSAASRLRVDLVPSRAITVLVTTDAAIALPVEGAEVSRRYEFALEDVVHHFAVHVPNRIPPTTSDGHVRVDGLSADETVELEARIAGRPAGRAECRPGETTATIVIPKPTTIPVQEGERPRPPDGTRLVVRGRRTIRTGIAGWIENGSIAVPLVEYEISPGLAIAPDGSLAPLQRVEPTSFFRPRSLVVRIVEEGERGVAGTSVSLSSSPYVEGPWDTPIPTDDEGRARFDGLAPVKHFVYAFPTARHPHGHRVDEVDLRPGDATREVVVGAEGAILARVTVDGKPALPEGLGWTIADGIVLGSVTDRAAGTVRIRARAVRVTSAPGSIEFSGRGVRSRLFSYRWPGRGGTTEIEAALSSSPEVVVDLRADPGSEVDVDVETWDATPFDERFWGEGEWMALRRDDMPWQTGRTSIDLPAGRYRLRDSRTGIASHAFDVADHAGKIVATLDLTGLVTVRGRVECPDPADAADIQLVIVGDGVDSYVGQYTPWGSRPGLPHDGESFALRVPAGRRVTISPWHPTLQPARDGGAVTLVGPRDDVVLRMGSGATLVARLVDPNGRPLSADELGEAIVSAMPAARQGIEPVVQFSSPVDGKPGTVSASGFPFGPLDVWVKANGFPARHVGRTTVTEDVADLGEVRMTRGTRVLLRRAAKSGPPSPPEGLIGRAIAVNGPLSYEESRASAEGGDVFGEFTGLREGHWRIEFVWLPQTANGQVRVLRAFEIDVDGEHDLTLDVDFDEPLAPPPK